MDDQLFTNLFVHFFYLLEKEVVDIICGVDGIKNRFWSGELRIDRKLVMTYVSGIIKRISNQVK